MDGEAAATAVTGEDGNQPQPDAAPAAEGGIIPAEGAPAGGLQIGEDGQPIPQPEEAKVEEIIPEEVLRDMENVWNVFDM